MFLHTWHPHPLAATIANIQLHWYGVLLAVAALAGIGMMEWLGKKYRLDTNRLFDLALITLVVGFIGARLYHVLNELTYYQTHLSDIFKVWNGGLALHGGIVAGGAALFFFARRWKWNPWLIADITVPALAIGQAIGRWGNYFNQELFGKPTSLPWGIPIDLMNRQSPFLTEQYFHPTFLYESLGLLIITVGLFLMHRRQWTTKGVKAGTITLAYIISYSALRMATEFLRIDRTPIIGGIRLPILVSGLFILAAIVILVIRNRHHAKTV